MHRSKGLQARTGFGVFVLGTTMGVLTNLVTFDPAAWPAVLQPLVRLAPVIGLGLVAAVGLRAVWIVRRGRDRPEWRGGNPYPGLSPYTEHQGGVFFGRGREVAELLDRVQNTRSVEDRFVPVVGPSGSGKSSLVMAGLVPALRAGSGYAVVPTFTPGTDVLAELSHVLGTEVATAADAALTAARAGTPAPRCSDIGAALTRLRGGARRLLLLVDQLEECYTQGVAEDRHRFLALLQALLAQEVRLQVVATIRSDTVGVFQDGPGSDLFRDPIMVNVMGPREVRLVVTEPARLTGTTFDEGLVEEIVKDAGGGDALPLLSYLLSDLYRNAAPDRHISWREYEAGGGVSGAITRRAEAALRQLGPDSLTRCLDTLLRFVTLGPGGATRQRVLASTLSDDEWQVVRTFVEARLLTSDQETSGQPVAGRRAIVIDIAHEALLRQWQPLREHIAAHEESLRRLTELTPMARAWLRSGRQPDYLITGGRLREALAWARGHRGLAPEVADFLDESERNQAGELERRADTVARAALEAVADEPATAVGIAVSAYELAPTPLAVVAMEAALASGMVRALPHAAAVTALAAAAGTLAAACGDHRVYGWSPTSDPLWVTDRHYDSVSAMAPRPDGGFVTLAGRTVRIVDRTGKVTRTGQCARPPSALACAADGSVLVGAPDGRIDLFGPDLAGRRPLRAGGSAVYALAAAGDGRVLAGLGCGTVLLWEAVDAPHRSFEVGGDAVLALAIGPHGHWACGLRDGAVTVRDRAGRPVGTRRMHRGAVRSLTFTPDGLLAVGDATGEVRVWPLDGAAGHALTEDGGPVQAVQYTDDGLLATASAYTGVHLWDLSGRLVRTLAAEAGIWSPIGSVAVSPAGHLVTGHADGTVLRWSPRVWTAPGETPELVLGPGNPVTAVAFNVAGHLVTGHPDGALVTWNADGTVGSRESRGGRAITGIVALPDGRVVVGYADGAVIDADTDLSPANQSDEAGLLAAGPDGQLTTLRRDGTVRAERSDAAIAVLDLGEVTAYAIAADGRMACATATGAVWITPPNREWRYRLSQHRAVGGLAFAPDGRLVVACGGTVHIWPHGTPPADLRALAARHPRPPADGARSVQSQVSTNEGPTG